VQFVYCRHGYPRAYTKRPGLLEAMHSFCTSVLARDIHWRQPLLGKQPNYIFYSIHVVYLDIMSASAMISPARSLSTTTTESSPKKTSSRTSSSVAMTSRRNSGPLRFQSIDHIVNTDRSHDLLVGISDQFAGRGGYQFPDHLSTSDLFSAQPESTSGYKSLSLDCPQREKGPRDAPAQLR
jgi:hypothetical protein